MLTSVNLPLCSVNGSYESQGKLGLAILSNGPAAASSKQPAPPPAAQSTYRLIMYVSKASPPVLSMRLLAEHFKLNVQANNYASFYDEQSQLWSILFPSSPGEEEAAARFATTVCLCLFNQQRGAHTTHANSSSVLASQPLLAMATSPTSEVVDVDDSIELAYSIARWSPTSMRLDEPTLVDMASIAHKPVRVRLGKNKLDQVGVLLSSNPKANTYMHN